MGPTRAGARVLSLDLNTFLSISNYRVRKDDRASLLLRQEQDLIETRCASMSEESAFEVGPEARANGFVFLARPLQHPDASPCARTFVKSGDAMSLDKKVLAFGSAVAVLLLASCGSNDDNGPRKAPPLSSPGVGATSGP